MPRGFITEMDGKRVASLQDAVLQRRAEVFDLRVECSWKGQAEGLVDTSCRALQRELRLFKMQSLEGHSFRPWPVGLCRNDDKV